MITQSLDENPRAGSKSVAVITFRPIPAVCRSVESIEDWSSQTVLGLVPLVEACPILTTTILRAANLPLYGLKSKISTLSHAMAMLGVPALRNLMTGTIRKPVVPLGDEDEKRAVGWRHALVTASLARAFGIKRSYDLPEEAYVAGLLHELGPHTTPRARPASPEPSEGESGSEPDDELDDTLWTVDSCRASSQFLEEWHLPSNLVHSVRLRNAQPHELEELDPKTIELINLLETAEHAATLLGDRLPAPGDQSVKIAELSASLDISIPELEQALHRARKQLFALLETLDHRPDEESDFSEELYRAAKSDSSSHESTSTPVASVEKKQPPSLKVVGSALSDLRKSGSTSKILDRVMEVAHRQFRFERVLYFKHEAKSGELVGHKIVDDSWRAVDPSEIRIPLQESDEALATCIEERRAIVLEDQDKSDLLRYFGVDQIGVVPVVEEETVEGFLFVDHFYSRSPIQDEVMTSLEILSSEAALLLENIKLSSESKALKKFAEKDELTNLNNRRYCIELCRKEVERARRYDTPLTLVMIDVDEFKEINDTFGHQVGDRVLREVARLIEKNSRRSDIIGRYGGDEFVVLLPEIPAEQAIVYAERMRNRVEQLKGELTELTPGLKFAISLGVGSLQPEDEDFDDLVARVDKALYAAKNRGRNRVCVG